MEDILNGRLGEIILPFLNKRVMEMSQTQLELACVFITAIAMQLLVRMVSLHQINRKPPKRRCLLDRLPLGRVHACIALRKRMQNRAFAKRFLKFYRNLGPRECVPASSPALQRA